MKQCTQCGGSWHETECKVGRTVSGASPYEAFRAPPVNEPRKAAQDTTPAQQVDHPSHYNVGGIEVIDAIEAWQLDFNLGNAVKYIARSEHKGCFETDLRKAIWYLERAIKRGERP